MVDVAELPAFLEISVSPPGDLYVDDSLIRLSTDAEIVDVDTGRHIVRVENSRASNPIIIDTVHVVADEARRLDYTFTMPKPKPKPPQVKVYDVRIGSEWRVRATVFIDGEEQADRAPGTFSIKEGEHAIRFEFVDNSGESHSLDTVVYVRSGTRITFPK